jgi:lysyl-tRNA synthetase class 1
VIKVHDEFDRFEKDVFADQSDKNAVARTTYELSLPDGVMPKAPPFRAAFRDLCNRLQICGGDIDRTAERYYASHLVTAEDKAAFRARCTCAWNWIQKHSREDFRYRLHEKPVEMTLSPLESKALSALRGLISTTDLDKITDKELNEQIYAAAIHGCGIEAPKEFFRVVYQKLIGRDQGPRLPGFIKEIGKDRVLSLL